MGTYPLYDLLSVTTSSGSIDITVSLHGPVANSPDKPAKLTLNASSGSISLKILGIDTPSLIPSRNYISHISSQSGSIQAKMLHGSSTTLQSSSGSIQASVYPHGPHNVPSHIKTSSSSGTTDFTLHSSLYCSTTPLRNLHGTHRGSSGRMKLTYPAQWQGHISGTTVSGRVNIDWPGIQVNIDRPNGFAGREIQAVHGRGEGKLNFNAVSGSVTLRGKASQVELAQLQS